MVKRLQQHTDLFFTALSSFAQQFTLMEVVCMQSRLINCTEKKLQLSTIVFALLLAGHVSALKAQQSDPTLDSLHQSQKEILKKKTAVEHEHLVTPSTGIRKGMRKESFKNAPVAGAAAKKREEKKIIADPVTPLAAGSNATPIDFSSLPADVKAHISANKASGKKILDGVGKGFTVKIATCTSPEETTKTLSFLAGEKGISGFSFVSAGLVKINTMIDFDSTTLKEILKSKGINFIFLDKFYYLQKEK